MNTKLFLFSSGLLLAFIAVACGSQPATPSVEAGPTTSHGGPVEVHVGLVDSLRNAGAAIEFGDPVEQAFFTVKGDIIKVNGADVQEFEYETSEAMEADAAQVAPDGGSIGTSMVTWVTTPHFYKAGRILVLYVGDDQTILDLLEGALGAQFAGR